MKAKMRKDRCLSKIRKVEGPSLAKQRTAKALAAVLVTRVE